MENRRKQQNDIEELENAFHNLSQPGVRKRGKYSKKGSGNKAIVLTLCVILLVAAAVLGCIFGFNSFRNNQVIASKLSILGVDVTGMTRKEAEDQIQNVFDKLYLDKTISVWIGDKCVEIPYSASGVKLDVRQAVNAAVSYEQSSDALQALDVTEYMTVNTENVIELLDAFTPLYTSALTQTTYKITGQKPASVTEKDEEASLALVITKGSPGFRLDIYSLFNTVMAGYSDGLTRIEYLCPVKEPDPLDLEAVFTKHCASAVDAVMDLKTFEITQEKYGYGFDVAEAQKAIENAAYGDTVTIAYQWSDPKVTAEELKATLFRDVLSEYTTKAGSNYDRNINLKLACESVNGIILNPGDVFSYNGALGERTPEKGYRPGASYVGSETVMDYGGGICQVSSTLYYCAVVADLKIVERDCHSYASSYTPLSTDATVFWNGIDFKFQNNTDYPIRIEASAQYGNVSVRLVGTDTKDYYVKFESVFLESYNYETVYKEMTSDNEKGYKDGDVITDPYTGYKSQGYRVKYDKQTGKMIERILESTDVYSTRDKVICKITDLPTEPETTVPETTVPETTVPETTMPETTKPETTEPETTLPEATTAPASSENSDNSSGTDEPAA